jgi:hypothetical protein
MESVAVASQLILHPTVTQSLKLLSTTAGRDKVEQVLPFPVSSVVLLFFTMNRHTELFNSSLGSSPGISPYKARRIAQNDGTRLKRISALAESVCITFASQSVPDTVLALFRQSCASASQWNISNLPYAHHKQWAKRPNRSPQLVDNCRTAVFLRMIQLYGYVSHCISNVNEMFLTHFTGKRGEVHSTVTRDRKESDQNGRSTLVYCDFVQYHPWSAQSALALSQFLAESYSDPEVGRTHG